MNLLEALQKLYPDSSKTTLRQWLKHGRVSVNGEVEKLGSRKIGPSDELRVGKKGRSEVPVLYEDQHLIVIDKPSGMLSVSTNFTKEGTAHAFVKERQPGKKVYVVHRLDQHTSGVMLFALSEKGYTALKALFKNHDIERKYLGIVEGNVPDRCGTWESSLYEDKNYIVRSSSNIGERAVTHYRKIAGIKSYSLIEFTLETGKKNQIRVHAADAGHPIAGDKKYGAGSNPVQRLCLHAFTLNFLHPVSKKRMRFHSPPPKCFQQLFPSSSLSSP